MITLHPTKISETNPDATWFAPDVGENRELPEKDRAALLIVPMSGRDLQAVRQSDVLPARSAQKTKDVGAYLDKRDWAVKIRVCEKNVKAIRNWNAADENGVTRALQNFGELKDAIMASQSAEMVGVIEQTFNAIVEHSVLAEGALGE